jgi:hypothetical protein
MRVRSKEQLLCQTQTLFLAGAVWRAGIWILAGMVVMTCASQARADDQPRYISLTGTKYTVDSKTERFRDGVLVGSEERVFERTVNASNGIDGEISNKVVDIHSDAADRLSPEDKRIYLMMLSGVFTQLTHYLLPTHSTYVSWPLDEHSMELPPITKMVTTTIDWRCDTDTFDSFFPLGRVTQIAVPCELVMQTGATPARPPVSVATKFSAEGEDVIETPAGSFNVKKVVITQTMPTGATMEQTLLFSEVWGLTVRGDAVMETNSGGTVLRTVEHRELLHIEPPH